MGAGDRGWDEGPAGRRRRVPPRGLREILESLEFRVVGEAGDGMEAVAEAERTNPDVVLMDLRMPVLGGIESTQLIRQRLPGVQVIILTAFDDFGLRVAAEEAGAYCYLPKGSSAQLISHSILGARAFSA